MAWHHSSQLLLLALRKALGCLWSTISTLTARDICRRVWTSVLRGLRVCIGPLFGHAEVCAWSGAGFEPALGDILRVAKGKLRPANPSLQSPTSACALGDPASGKFTGQHASELVPEPSCQISCQPSCSYVSSMVLLRPLEPQTSFLGKLPVPQVEEPQPEGQLAHPPLLLLGAKPVTPEKKYNGTTKIRTYYTKEIPKGKLEYAESDIARWRRFVHPEGALYFHRCIPGTRRRVFTDTDLSVPRRLEQVNDFVQSLFDAATQLPIGPHTMLVLVSKYDNIPPQKKQLCSCYFVDHDKININILGSSSQVN
ncbi:hypothetical protein BS17DRAFT_253853 [Gyrodon lividus]|nr:hypothetical protein BS17DRAFT_253853 [Gyrodon lividus]